MSLREPTRNRRLPAEVLRWVKVKKKSLLARRCWTILLFVWRLCFRLETNRMQNARVFLRKGLVVLAISGGLLAGCVTTNPYSEQIARLDASYKAGNISYGDYIDRREDLEGKKAEFDLESAQTSATIVNAVSGVASTIILADVARAPRYKHRPGPGSRAPAPRAPAPRAAPAPRRPPRP